jgi:predicted nucleic acid-binding protein
MIKPHLYLDTCIILDDVYGRRQSSKLLLEQAKKEVEQGNWLCSTSRWTMVELFDNMKEELYVKNLRADCELWSSIGRKIGNRHQKEALTKPELDTIWKQLHEYTTEKYPFIKFKYPITEAMWNKAEDYCSGTNISSPDALHLASALEIECNILVSTDGDFMAIAKDYINTVQPSDIDKAISKLNR